MDNDFTEYAIIDKASGGLLDYGVDIAMDYIKLPDGYSRDDMYLITSPCDAVCPTGR